VTEIHLTTVNKVFNLYCAINFQVVNHDAIFLVIVFAVTIKRNLTTPRD